MEKKKLSNLIKKKIMLQNIDNDIRECFNHQYLDDLERALIPLFCARTLFLLNKKYDVKDFCFIPDPIEDDIVLHVKLNIPKPYSDGGPRYILLTLSSNYAYHFDTTSEMPNFNKTFEYEPFIREIICLARGSVTNDICMYTYAYEESKSTESLKYKLFKINPYKSKITISLDGGHVDIKCDRTKIFVEDKYKDRIHIHETLTKIANTVENLLYNVSPFFGITRSETLNNIYQKELAKQK